MFNNNKYVLLGLVLLRLTSSSYGGDNLALLSGTLRTFQKTTCDAEKVSLGCPRGTSISIELAQYEKNGIDGYNLCPTASTELAVGGATADGASSNGTHSNEISTSGHQESCLWPNALQYSLLQTAIEACQKKTHCKFMPAPKTFGGNPCPGIRKIVEYAYKCRPYEFRSKVACENEVIQLVCNPFSRIAIYSASYGRTEYESIQCTQPQGVKEETCLVSFATETVMQLCHGRRRCTISADTTTFGNPCRPDSRMYLKTVYTCVPRKVLRESFDIPLESDEKSQEESAYENELLDEDDQHYKESEAIPPAPKLQGTVPRTETNGTQVIKVKSGSTSVAAGGGSDSNAIQNQRTFTEEHHHDELFYICLFFGIAVLILLTSIMLVIGRIVLNKRNSSINSGAASVSELSSTTVDAITKIQSTDTVVVTTVAGATTGANGSKADDCIVENTTADQLAMDLTTPMSIPSISSRNNHLYNTYTPSSYGNLEPSSISYALVTPNLYSSNQATLHNSLMRPPSQTPPLLSSSALATAASAARYNQAVMPPNLRNVSTLTFQTQPHPPHHILIPTNATQTLNRHLYQFNHRLSPNASSSARATSSFLNPVGPSSTMSTAVIPATVITAVAPPPSILRNSNATRAVATANINDDSATTGNYLYG